MRMHMSRKEHANNTSANAVGRQRLAGRGGMVLRAHAADGRRACARVHARGAHLIYAQV